MNYYGKKYCVEAFPFYFLINSNNTHTQQQKQQQPQKAALKDEDDEEKPKKKQCEFDLLTQSTFNVDDCKRQFLASKDFAAEFKKPLAHF